MKHHYRDGWEWHDKRRRNFEQGRKRRAELAAAGYVVVPCTWTMLKRQQPWVASIVKSAVIREPELGGRRVGFRRDGRPEGI